MFYVVLCDLFCVNLFVGDSIVNMALARVTAFIQGRDVHDFYQLTREELCSLANEMEIVLEVERKEDMQREIKRVLEERNFFYKDSENDGESDDNPKVDKQCEDLQMPQLEKLPGDLSSSERIEMLKFQIEMQTQLQLQMKKVEKEAENRRAEIEADKEVRLKQAEFGGTSEKIDFDHRVKHVPEFVEGEEENFFLQFEKVAKLREWNVKDWPLLVQSKFKGKAREAYVNLTDMEIKDYETIKEAVLRSTLLSSRVYRERFRNTRKRPGSTYLEMARECGLKFDRWMKSEEAETAEEIKGVILLEHFMDQIHPDIKYELISHGVKDIMEAGRRADSYCEAKGIGRGDHGGKKPFFNRSEGPNKFKTNNIQDMSSWHYNRPLQPKPFNNNNYKPQNHNMNMNSSMNNSNQPRAHNLRTTNARNWREGLRSWQTGSLKCLACGEAGHRKFECPNYKPKPVAAVAAQNELLDFIKESMPLPSPEQQTEEEFERFVIKGKAKLNGGQEREIRILRDTAANQSLILANVLPWNQESNTGKDVVCKGAVCKFDIPLHKVWLDCGYVTGEVTVGVKDTLPIDGVDMLMGNDLAGGKVIPNLQMVENPVQEILESNSPVTVPNLTPLEDMVPEVYPVCAVTRAMARRGITDEDEVIQEDPDLGAFFVEPSDLENSLENGENKVEQVVEPKVEMVVEKNVLIQEQEKDESLKLLWNEADKADNTGDEHIGCYVEKGVLMRNWRPLDSPADEHWKVRKQIVVPKVYRKKILELAHEGSLAGHLGVRKTLGKITCHFYWPKVKSDVAEYCKTCSVCQKVGKPNQVIKPAPLKPIPVIEEPFAKIIIDCVGPLPKTRKGHQYLLTMMCASSKFPEAIPLRSIHSKNIMRELIKYFSWVGIPKVIQSDQGSNFTSKLFKDILRDLKVEQKLSSAYHPQSQGSVERFHQTLKNVLRMYCEDMGLDWDEALPLVLFALRDSVQESTGFSPFELVYGHEVNGPLRMLKERWLGREDSPSVVKYVSDFKSRLMRAREIALKNLSMSQEEMKTWYDRKARSREFKVGDKVLVLFPLQSDPLRARFSGPWKIEKKISAENYVVATPGRRKKNQLCHVNMLKPYFEREDESDQEIRQGSKKVAVVVNATQASEEKWAGEKLSKCEAVVLENSTILENLNHKLKHVNLEKRERLTEVIRKYESLFPNAPRKTNVVKHDVDVGDAKPVKQHPYRVNPQKRAIMRKEIEYMLENDLIEPSDSPWSSPCVLVPKPGQGSFRFCTDYRKVNMVTKADAYPIPRIDDCIDNVGCANFITKIDLLKGYWQVELTERAKAISAFVTMDGLYQYKVLPFGMKNSGSSFQRLMNKVLKGLKNCSVYIDDILLYTESWEEHLSLLEEVFRRLDEANLTINLTKSHFVQSSVEYLGFKIGNGQVKTVEAKVNDIVNLPTPTNRKEILRFLGASGYYRRFCKNFSDVAMPLTKLLSKKSKFKWDEKCQEAFQKIKNMLVSAPVLRIPDFDKSFILYVDASQVGIGGVLMQEHEGVEHPVGYYSRKLLPYQCSYSTIEKEALGLIMSLSHFDVYVKGSGQPVQVFTDHNPLVFLYKMKNTNQRLMRWCLVLQDYDLEISHVRGSENVLADALSRAPSSREASK